MTFVFKAQNNVEQMICDTVRAIGGKVVSHKGTVITAKWRSKRYLTVFRKTFKFYIGSDVVRVNYGTYTGSNGRGMITLSHGKAAVSSDCGWNLLNSCWLLIPESILVSEVVRLLLIVSKFSQMVSSR